MLPPPLLPSLLSIGFGAAFGAILRWALGNWLNATYPAVPLGTLAANLLGAYLIGVAVAFFAETPSLSPLWRLALITGFLGGLTTFSTFSAEVVSNLMAGRLGAALAGAGLHVLGSFGMTMLGIASLRAGR